MQVNSCHYIGNLGKDPEMKVFESGDKIANFSIAVDDSYKKKDGEKVQRTEWINITAKRGLADICEKYLSKGMQVYVEGRSRTRTYEDSNKITRYVTEIHANTVQMLGRKEVSSVAGTQFTPPITEVEDDLPF